MPMGVERNTMLTNAYSTKLATHLVDLVDSMGKSPRFVRLLHTLAGEVQRGVRRGNHQVDALVLAGISYRNAVRRSLCILEENMKNREFTGSLVDQLAADGVRDERTGAAITTEDVVDALIGTVRGRKGLVTAYLETLAGDNPDYTSGHVYEPLQVNGGTLRGCKVYVGDVVQMDPESPMPGTTYLAGITIAARVTVPAPNGDIVPSRRGAVARTKAWLEESLGLPVARYRIYRLHPNDVTFEVKCGREHFHALMLGPQR